MPTGNGKKHVGGGDRVTRGSDVRARGLRFERGRLVVAYADGRELSVPLAWYPTLEAAPAATRARWRMIGHGTGFHWPDLDLDLSVLGLTSGLPEAIPRPTRLSPRVSAAPARVPRRRSA